MPTIARDTSQIFELVLVDLLELPVKAIAAAADEQHENDQDVAGIWFDVFSCEYHDPGNLYTVLAAWALPAILPSAV